MRTIAIAELMAHSNVKFGTSGARGLVTAMSDAVCFAYTAAFVDELLERGDIGRHEPIAIAGDRRSSTPRIKAAIAAAIRHRGLPVLDCGEVPTPALALLGLQRGWATIMVTGSHIPDDRNGIKFNTPTGEILKRDEQAIAARLVEVPAIFDARDMLREATAPGDVHPDAAEVYRARFVRAFGPRALVGRTIAVYGHSAVGRTLIPEILRGLGAHVIELGFSEQFVSVDTEAIRPEDVELAAAWAAAHRFDAIVSTDGDSDRPLVSDEHGQWLRGDVTGILTARCFGARTVVTPVSSNSAVERSAAFDRVIRTKIGSPYVIEAMQAELDRGASGVVGYEANGGFLNASPLQAPHEPLRPLPTRDAVIVMLGVLLSAEGSSVSSQVADLPRRFTASDRLEDFPTDRSARHIAALRRDGIPAMAELFDGDLGEPNTVDDTDGLRMSFAEGDVVHLRPSGNAPELRCYVEADSPERAARLLERALHAVTRWRDA